MTLATLNRQGLAILAEMVEQPEPRTFATIMCDLEAVKVATDRIYAAARTRDLTDAENDEWTALDRRTDKLRDEAKARLFALTGVTWDAMERGL